MNHCLHQGRKEVEDLLEQEEQKNSESRAYQSCNYGMLGGGGTLHVLQVSPLIIPDILVFIYLFVIKHKIVGDKGIIVKIK